MLKKEKIRKFSVKRKNEFFYSRGVKGMKFLLVLMVFMSFLIFASHVEAYDPEIDWDYPHEECSNGDWRSEWYVLYYEGNMGEYPVKSPFYMVDPDHLTHIAHEDDSNFKPDDGWELLAVNLGDPYGYSSTIPFFALYNRYSSVVRAFCYLDPLENWTATLMNAEYKDNDVALLAHASENNYLRAADKRNEESDNTYCKPIEQGNKSWYYADYDIMYDPIDRDYGDGYLAFHLKGYSEYSINLDFVSDEISSSGENGFDPFELGKKINSHWSEAGDWLDNFDDVVNLEVPWFWNYTGTFLDPMIAASSSLADDIQSTGLPALIPYANVIFGIYSFFNSGDSKSIIESLVEDVQIIGTMTQMDEIDDFTIYEPITGQTGGSGGKAVEPVYPYTLGTFNLETTPIMEYRECDFTYYDVQGYPIDVLFHSYRVQDDIDYVINPDCGLKSEVNDMEIAIQGVFNLEDSDVLIQSDKAQLLARFFDWCDEGNYTVIAQDGSVWYNTDFIFRTEFIDYEDFKHTVINAPDCTEFVFKIKTVLEVEDNPNHDPILFMADYLPDTELVGGYEPFPYSPDQQIVVLYEDTVINSDTELDHNIVVSPNVCLTIQNCNFNTQDFYITVNSGELVFDNCEAYIFSKLILNGSECKFNNGSHINLFGGGGELLLLNHSTLRVNSNSEFEVRPGSSIKGSTPVTWYDPASGSTSPVPLNYGAEERIPGDRIIVSGENSILNIHGDYNPVNICPIDGASGWEGIIFENSDPSNFNPNNIIEQCLITGIGIISYNSSLKIEYSIFSNCSSIRFHNSVGRLIWVTTGSIISYESPLKLHSCTIENGSGNGISFYYPTFDSISIVDYSTIQNNNKRGIDCYNQMAKIRACNIIDNSTHGLVSMNEANVALYSTTISNNYGAEIIGSYSAFPLLNYEWYQNNTIEDDEYDEGTWDKYLLICTGYEDSMDQIDCRNNTFNPDHNSAPDRFFPSDAYIFDGELSPYKQMFYEGLSYAYNDNYEQAKLTMKNVIEEYPETKTAEEAINVLTHLEKLEGENYEELRNYLENIDDDMFPNLELARYKAVTNTYISEKDYLTAISRFEELVNNPPSYEDSLYAYIDEGYCYLKLDEQGGKAGSVECKFKPRSFDEFKYVSQNLTKNLLDKAIPTPEPPTTDQETVEFALNQNYPNPASLSTTFSFSIPANTKNADLKIYNIKGQLVKTFILESNEKGTTCNYKWNLKVENGMTLSNGIYFYKLTADKKEIVKKMVLMR